MISSGGIGYCPYLRHSRGIIVNWDNNTVESVECEHDKCGYSQECALYQKYPVGYVRTFPDSKSLD